MKINLKMSPLIIGALLLIAIGCISHHVRSQEPIIKGKVVNTKNEPILYAAVTLYKLSDSTLIKATITKEDGTFLLENLSPESSFLKISSLGYEEYTTGPNVKGNLVFTLEEDALELNEVQVTAKKPLVQVLADKTVFNVENSLSTTGVSGFELLRKAPGIVIDNNDNLILEGKTGALIYIDGKPSMLTGTDLSNYLKTLQATDIEAIEIITQPSSKFDAAGNAGIVNIKFKKDKRFGSNGTLGAGFAIGRLPKYNSSVSFNNRNKRVHLFGSFSNRFGETYSFINLYRIQNSTIFDAKSENETYNRNSNAKLGADIFATEKSTLGIVLQGNFNNYNALNTSKTPIIPQQTNRPEQVLLAESTTDANAYNLNGNINYRFADTLGHTLNMDLDFGNYKNERFNLQPNRYFNGMETEIESQFTYYMITPIDIDIRSFKIDYEQDYKGGKLGLGLKTSLVHTDNTFQFFDVLNGENIVNNTRSNNFVYKETIHAGYINYGKKWDKVNLQVGLRAEQTISDGKLNSIQENQNERVERNYVNLFPSGGITYTANDNNALALGYSMRIERPNYQSLNPFEIQIDELTFSRGNPFLQPQYTNNIKISHTYKYTLNTSLSYSRIQDFFAQVTDAEGENRSFMQTRNIANQEVINLGVSYPFNVTKWWSFFGSLNAYRSSYKAKDENFVAIDQNTLSFYGQNTLTLPKGFQFEVSGWYSSPSVWGGTYRSKSLGSLDVAVQKKVWNDKVSIRIAASDILFTSPWEGDTRFGNVYIQGNGGWESRQLTLNLNYNFGNNEVKASERRKSGIEEENQRIE